MQPSNDLPSRASHRDPATAPLPGLRAAHYEARKKEVIINTRVTQALRDRVRLQAEAAGLSMARYVRAVLEEAVARP